MSGAHTTCHLEVEFIVIGGTSLRTDADDCWFKVRIKHLVVGFLHHFPNPLHLGLFQDHSIDSIIDVMLVLMQPDWLPCLDFCLHH